MSLGSPVDTDPVDRPEALRLEVKGLAADPDGEVTQRSAVVGSGLRHGADQRLKRRTGPGRIEECEVYRG